MATLAVIVGGLLGAAIGSYLTCVSWRLPRRIRITGRSICPACKAQLKPHWNVPLLGWLSLRGRAGCCGNRISARYPLVEMMSALAGAGIGWQYGLVAVWVTTAVLVAVTAVASFATARTSV